MRLRPAAAVEVVARVGVSGEEGVETAAEVVAGGLMPRLAVEVDFLAGVGREVVEFVGAFGAMDVLPTGGADRAGRLHLVEDGAVRVGRFAAEDGREVATGGPRLRRHRLAA